MLRSLTKIALRILMWMFLASLAAVLVLKWVPVWYTPLMASRSLSHMGDESFVTRKTWVPIEKISGEMVKAVVSSEDNRFFTHKGFDFEQIRSAIEENKTRKRERGASTISQQTAKNVFTFHSRTWLRKGLETYFTILIEIVWGKKRIMEVYLNVVELGNGVYGTEAASQLYFGKPASKLTRHEACLFAGCLPSPLKRNPAKPSPYLLKRSLQIAILVPKLEYPEWVVPKKKK